MGKQLRVVNMLVSVSASIATSAIDLDYRFDGSPTRAFWVVKAAASAPSIFLQGAPTVDGPWLDFAEVTAACTTTIVRLDFEPPFVRVNQAAGGDRAATVIAVI